MSRNASQRKDIRKFEKISAEAEAARINFIVAAMSTSAGRVYFHSLLAGCSIFNDPFTGDALMDNFVKGQRNIGLMIYNDIVANCPDYFILMMKEASIKELSNDRRTDSPADDELSGSEDGDGRD